MWDVILLNAWFFLLPSLISFYLSPGCNCDVQFRNGHQIRITNVTSDEMILLRAALENGPNIESLSLGGTAISVYWMLIMITVKELKRNILRRTTEAPMDAAGDNWWIGMI